MPDVLERLKVLLDSSTPIVVIETVEEMRAVRLVRGWRDVGQKFSANRRTIVITAPAFTVPAELRGLIEFVELPLPDAPRLRQILDEVAARLGQTRTLHSSLDNTGLDAVATSLRGLTEEEADRAISQAVVTRYGLVPATVTDVLDADRKSVV